MKETYPLPTQGKKPPAPNAERKPPGPNPHPNNALQGTQREWEEAVFRHAHHFNVFRYGPGRLPSERRQTVEYQTFPEALTDATQDDRALIYAVTEEGRSFCVPRNEWLVYSAIWDEQHSSMA